MSYLEKLLAGVMVEGLWGITGRFSYPEFPDNCQEYPNFKVVESDHLKKKRHYGKTK